VSGCGPGISRYDIGTNCYDCLAISACGGIGFKKINEGESSWRSPDVEAVLRGLVRQKIQKMEERRQQEARAAEETRQQKAREAEEKRQQKAREAEEKRKRKARQAEGKRQLEERMVKVLHRLMKARMTIKTPAAHGVLGDNPVLSFDSESLTWDNSAFEEFFDAVATLSKRAEYSLAIRKWPFSENSPESSLPLPQGVDWDNNAAFTEIGKAVAEDFGDDVQCSIRKAALLLRSGYEDLDKGILLSPKERLGFRHISLFANVFQMGRRMNICVYTLFSPTQGDFEAQKSLAIMLKENQRQKLSVFENTLRSSVLRGVALYKETLGSGGEVTY
jgi:hypothetical protein